MKEDDENSVFPLLRRLGPSDLALPAYQRYAGEDIRRLTEQLAAQMGIRHRHEIGGLPAYLLASGPKHYRGAVEGAHITSACPDLANADRSEEMVIVAFHLFLDVVEMSIRDVGAVLEAMKAYFPYVDDLGLLVIRKPLDIGWQLTVDGTAVQFSCIARRA